MLINLKNSIKFIFIEFFFSYILMLVLSLLEFSASPIYRFCFLVLLYKLNSVRLYGVSGKGVLLQDYNLGNAWQWLLEKAAGSVYLQGLERLPSLNGELLDSGKFDREVAKLLDL